MDVEQNTNDLQRIRSFVVEVLIKQFVHFQIDRNQVAEIARAVLDQTKEVQDLAGLRKVTNELAVKYPVLKQVEIREQDYEQHQVEEQKASQLIDLLRQGDLDGAVSLTHRFEQQSS